MRTAIYGAGSLGTILGAFINKAGEPIELINRNKAHVEALNANGAQVTGTMEFNQKVKAYTPDQMSGEYDILLFILRDVQPEILSCCILVGHTCNMITYGSLKIVVLFEGIVLNGLSVKLYSFMVTVLL